MEELTNCFKELNCNGADGIGKFNLNGKPTLMCNDSDITKLLFKGPDKEVMKPMTRAENVVVKIFGEVNVLPPTHVLMTSNINLKIGNNEFK